MIKPRMQLITCQQLLPDLQRSAPRETFRSSSRQLATSNSASLRLCVRLGCPVTGQYRYCCYQPTCRERRPRECAWLNYVTGKNVKKITLKHLIYGCISLILGFLPEIGCPRPSTVLHGTWTCEESQTTGPFGQKLPNNHGD